MARILVVDDEPGYRKHLRRILSDAGYEVETVGTSAEALDLGSRHPPDVLVADWMLKDVLCGIEIAEILRASNASLKVIIISGYPSSELLEKAAAFGISEFIEKPFSSRKIRDAVGRVLGSPPISPKG